MSTLAECLKLMVLSDYHRGMHVTDINRCLIPAIENNRCLLWFDDDFVTQAFMTFAFLDQEARDGYGVDRLLQPEDFERSNHDGTTPFIIDFVSPFGNTRKYVREARQFLGEAFGDRVWHWYRPAKDWQMGYAIARSDAGTIVASGN